ncbi:flagellar export chaperone FlgN [Patulibacter defluvii]|uniref:flagellar export chaperone FlgN n=1 Tax=Patulibacter defluvii TaxID=3095358 RepID=UPI002A7631CE|nr:flagellar export chaperone FlgN [Patulibacter sp. DM4]
MTVPGIAGTVLGRELLVHLDEQHRSAERLRAAVAGQSAALRARDVDALLARTAELDAEVVFRATLEERRARLLARGAALLGAEPQAVTLERLATLATPEEADAARERSAALAAVLDEVRREHGCNQALVRQELAFLDHLLHLGGAAPEATYAPPRARPGAAPAHAALDLRA